jgi:hypothetical protein
MVAGPTAVQPGLGAAEARGARAGTHAHREARASVWQLANERSTVRSAAMFNLGASEVMVIVVVALAFLGPKVGGTWDSDHARTVPVGKRSPWRWSDWVLVATVAILGLVAGALALRGT